eukprot:s113_g11.t1
MWSWLAVVLSLGLPEAILKVYSYGARENMSGTLLDLGLAGNHLKISWGFHLNLGSALGFWVPSFQSAIGPVGSKLLITLGVLASGFFVAWASRQVTHRSSRLGLIFLIAGGLGNVADRLSVGGVIDYWLLSISGILNTSFFWNLSDLYIDFAVILLCWAMWHGEFSHLESQGTGAAPGSSETEKKEQ